MQTDGITNFLCNASDSLFIAVGLGKLVTDNYAHRKAARKEAPQKPVVQKAIENKSSVFSFLDINVPVSGRVTAPENSDVLHLTL